MAVFAGGAIAMMLSRDGQWRAATDDNEHYVYAIAL
jgi:hypothetical protein